MAKNYMIIGISYDWIRKVYVWRTDYMTREMFIHRLAINSIYAKDSSILAKRLSGFSNVELDMILNKSIGYDYHKSGYILVTKIKDVISEVDIDSMEAEIEAERLRILEHKARVKAKIAAEQRSQKSEFRRGPVAYTSHTKFSKYFRNPRLGRVKRQGSIVEYKEFMTPDMGYKNLPCFDDRKRHYDKSWKSSYKVKKQWMKHQDRHIDTYDSSVNRVDLFKDLEAS